MKSIEHLLKREKLWRILLIAFSAIFVFFLVLLPLFDYENEYMAFLCLMGLFPSCSAIVYFIKYFPLYRTILWVRKEAGPHSLDDLHTKSVYLKQSEIYIGEFAMFLANHAQLIPLSAIAWLYIDEGTDQVHLFCKNGKSFIFMADRGEFDLFIEKFLKPSYPDIQYGNTAQQKQKYLLENPEAIKCQNRKKLIWGIVLITLGIFLSIIAIINGGALPAGYILLAILYFGGGYLIYQSQKL